MNEKTQELVQLDPATLTVDTNVRKDAGLTPAFVSSIRELGVLEPVIAHRKADGTVHVLMGQRRTLAAVEAKLGTIPVVVIDSPDEADRIITQVVENIQRAELGHADQADAFQQLSLLGMPAAKIAKKMGRTKVDVEQGIAAKSSEAGFKALEEGHDFEVALIFAEFADDTDATEEIESVLADEPSQLHHVAQQLRDRREAEKKLAETVASHEARGLENVGELGYSDDTETARVSHLLKADGAEVTDEDANAFGIRRAYHGGTVILVVKGWKTLGYTEKYGSSATPAKGPMSEEQKEERRTLIANNKAMESASTVRRDWVKNLLARKTAPKGWQYFSVLSMTSFYDIGRSYDGELAADLISAKAEKESTDWGYNPFKEHVATHETRPEFALLAMVIASFEKQMPKDIWRNPSKEATFYLGKLIEWGYTPSEVEKILIAD